MKIYCLLFYLLLLPLMAGANPVDRLLERLEKGASSRFVTERVAAEKDFFELSARKGKVVVRGNTYVNIAAGVHYYLKHYLHQQVAWNNFRIQLPDHLPLPEQVERHETDL